VAATRIIACFNLKKGTSAAQYESWARTVDLPTVNKLPSIERFTVHKAVGVLGSDAPAPYQYVEIIDVKDMTGFGRDIASPEMQKIAASFREMADVVFMTTNEIR
jgi:hypothetical protein